MVSNSSVQITQCPSLDWLIAFDRGEMSDSQINQVSKHLDHCEKCRQTLESLQPDDFASSISELARCRHASQVLMSAQYEQSIDQVIQRLSDEQSSSSRVDFSKTEDYEIGEPLGSGQFGKVFKARYKPTGDKVAIKITCNDVTFSRSQIEYFLSDVELAQRLEHENLVKIYDYGFWSVSEAFVAMERIRGHRLSRWLYVSEGRPVRAAVGYFRQILDAVEYLHQHEVVHRNLKPENVFIDRRGRVVVTDVGMFVDERYMKSNQPIYDPEFFYFSAPEQLHFDHRNVNVRSDIFSLGRILQRIVEFASGYRGVSELENTILAPLVKISEACTRENREHRFAAVCDIRNALDDAGF